MHHLLRHNFFLLLALLLLGMGTVSVVEAQLFPRMKSNMREASYEKPKFLIGLDSRRSFIENREVRIFGARVGVDFDHRWRVGIGFYSLLGDNRGTYTINQDTVLGRINFSYVAWFFEYVFYRHKRWEFSIPGYVGTGTSRLETADSLTRKGVGVSELSVQGHFKVFRWIGVGAGVGYRYLFIPNKQIDQNFNNFIYNFKVRIWIGPIYRAIFKKDNKWDDEWKSGLGRPVEGYGYGGSWGGRGGSWGGELGGGSGTSSGTSSGFRFISCRNTHNYRYRFHAPQLNTILQSSPPVHGIATSQYFPRKAF